MDKSLAVRIVTLSRMRAYRVISLWPGTLAVAFLGTVIGGSLAGIMARFGTGDLMAIVTDAYLHSVIGFTLWQATLSTLISVGLALPIARAYARQSHFVGRRTLITLMGLPMVMPVIVAVLGIVAVYGHNGVITQLMRTAGFTWPFGIYGLGGILLAHVFFNLPLAVRLLLPAWERVPGESWRLASTLGMSSTQLFRFIEWPALSAFLPGALVIVFLLCFTSFAVVLTLGGGPGATTVEVAIYQALRFDFDPGRATLLALTQLVLCATIALTMSRWLRSQPLTQGLQEGVRNRPDRKAPLNRTVDVLLITVSALFIGLPIAAVVVAGLEGPLLRVILDSALWSATARSLGIALIATLIAGVLALGLAMTARRLVLVQRRPGATDLVLLAGSVSLAVPPMVIGTGLFLWALMTGTTEVVTLLLIALINALMILPYALRSIAPVLIDSGRRHHKLCEQLGLQGWQRFRRIDWPAIRKPTAFAVALGSALSFGDMGVAALFDTSGAITLPVMLYHRMSAYRFDEAAVTALVLVVMSLILFWALDRIVGRWLS